MLPWPRDERRQAAASGPFLSRAAPLHLSTPAGRALPAGSSWGRAPAGVADRLPLPRLSSSVSSEHWCPGPELPGSVGARRAGLLGETARQEPLDSGVWRALGAHRSRNWGPGAVLVPEDGAERPREAPTKGLVGKWPSRPQGEPATVGRRVWPGWDSGQDTAESPPARLRREACLATTGRTGGWEPACWGSAGTCRLGAPRCSREKASGVGTVSRPLARLL